ncbi:MAG: hypothetical protein ACRD4D_07195, partial [Candidatus Acidiferrales bacterium]
NHRHQHRVVAPYLAPIDSMHTDSDNAKLLELAPAELLVPLKVSHAGRSYRLQHRLRPPAPADWFAYEAALEMAVEEMPAAADDEPCYRLHVRTSDAARLLWDRLAVGVDGYDLPSGNEAAPTSQTPSPAAPAAGGDWRALIPLAHKEAAISSLTLVAPSTLPESTNNESTNYFFPLLADERVVVLEAARAGRAYPRLLHRFRPPSVENERTYRRLLSETLLVRGSRAPRTLLPARLPGLVRLYDQLILGVEGYAVAGQLPASSPQITQTMDAWHKRVAVQTLFGDLAAAASSDSDLLETA